MKTLNGIDFDHWSLAQPTETVREETFEDQTKRINKLKEKNLKQKNK